MKILATIEARMASSRLPNKILAPILGRPMLELFIERVKRSASIDQIVIATTTSSIDDVLVDYARKWRVGLFRGSSDDVLGRVLEAAQKFRADTIVELTGDCPVLDPEIIDQAIKTFTSSKVDYVANTTIAQNFPRGMDVQVFPRKILEQVARETNDPYDHEHVSLYIYSHPEKFRLKSIKAPGILRRPDLRLTVDTGKDLELIRRIYHLLYAKKPNFGLADIIDLFDRFPKLPKINADVRQKPARYSKTLDQQFKRGLQKGHNWFQGKFTAAVIGCGNMGSLFDDDGKRKNVSSHAGAYNTHPDVKLIAAGDVDSKALKKFGQRWDIDHLYQDYRELLQKERPDIVSITTKNDMHYDVAREAIKRGVKAVFCEKPFTDSLRKAKELVNLSQKSRTLIIVNYNRRFDKAHRKAAKEGLKFGKPAGGTVYYVNGFINNGCHAIDLVQQFMGKIKKVQTISQSSFPREDPNFSVLLTLENEAEVLVKGLDQCDYYMFEADFLFARGRIQLLDRGQQIKLFESEEDDTIDDIKSVYHGVKTFTGLKDHLPEAIQNVVAILDKGEENLSSGMNAQKVLEIMTATFISSEQGRKPIVLPLQEIDHSLISRIKSL